MASRARTGNAGGEAVIGASTRIRGKIAGSGDLRLEGSVEGDITIDGDLVIATGGRAESAVEARSVTVGGELEGDVRADGPVRIEAGARMKGDVHGGAVAIDDGAEFVGHLHADFELPAELGGAASGGGKRR